MNLLVKETKGFQRREGALGGVCEALAEQFNLNPKGLRIIFIILQFSVCPFLIVLYGLACLLFERKKDPLNHPSHLLIQLESDFEDLDKKVAAIEGLSVSKAMDHHIEMGRNTPLKAKKDS